MRLKFSARVIGFLTIFSVYGCSSYQIAPEPPLVEHKAELQIDMYSFEYKSLFKNEQLERILEAKNAVTLNRAIRVPAFPKNFGGALSHHLAIQVVNNGSGGACPQDFLTGLSLGLIPSWCTRERRFSFQFQLYENDRLCGSNDFSVNETMYGHLLLIPIGLFQEFVIPYRSFSDFYDKALKSMIIKGCSDVR